MQALIQERRYYSWDADRVSQDDTTVIIAASLHEALADLRRSAATDLIQNMSAAAFIWSGDGVLEHYCSLFGVDVGAYRAAAERIMHALPRHHISWRTRRALARDPSLDPDPSINPHPGDLLLYTRASGGGRAELCDRARVVISVCDGTDDGCPRNEQALVLYSRMDRAGREWERTTPLVAWRRWAEDAVLIERARELCADRSAPQTRSMNR